MLISLSDRDALYCVSDDLIESIITSSGFCVFTGTSNICFLARQTTWLMHAFSVLHVWQTPLICPACMADYTYLSCCMADSMAHACFSVHACLATTWLMHAFLCYIGVVFYYGLLQLLTWWICHVTILFWKIKFPFQARSFDQSNRTKYIHIACILISLFLPLVPILITIGNNLDEPRLGTVGFTMTRFPPLLCTSIDSNATFYALVLPVILILDTGLALLIIMLWFIHKVQLLTYCFLFLSIMPLACTLLTPMHYPIRGNNVIGHPLIIQQKSYEKYAIGITIRPVAL